MGIEPFDCSATQMLNGSCILDVVVGDSLSRCILILRIVVALILRVISSLHACRE